MANNRYIVRCPKGDRWLVREAISLNHAFNAIAYAKVTGSVGASDTQTDYAPGKPYHEWPTKVLANVVRLNSDNTECQPY